MVLLLFADDAKTVLMTLLAAKCTVKMTVSTFKSEAMVPLQELELRPETLGECLQRDRL